MGEQIFAGFAGALGIKKETTWNQKATPPSRYLEIESETFEEARNWIDTQGIDGTRSRSKSRSAPTTIDPRGGFKIAGVKGADLLDLLELALGSQGTGTAFCADLLPSFTTVVLKGNQYSVFTGCVMSKLDFDASDADQALKLAAEAVAGALVIGTAPDLGTPSYANESPLVFAGSTISAGAASVVAKVARDRLMEAYDALYPGYDLARNKGYAAPEHRAGLDARGLSQIHRLSFAPCREREQMTLWQDAGAIVPDEADGTSDSDDPEVLEAID